ncbi:hypothetical protein F2P45_14885 [Massilia sp. CCM 8733]|uniref:Uncharacterized protein n=1 Tax=Massilia mucilaginosa TaxID=2609282 RepID=A0ABX0NTX0_9BURK|nr:hypothetical protein [Massilia mucilaginosa]NHZ90292.1 hypothetical protein [Massilia mucilaginosa]
MSTSSTEEYPQDDLSGVLATPPGTGHLAPLRPEPLPLVVVAAEAAAASAGAGAAPAGPEPAGRVLQVVVGATVVGCAAAGLFAWIG